MKYLEHKQFVSMMILKPVNMTMNTLEFLGIILEAKNCWRMFDHTVIPEFASALIK